MRPALQFHADAVEVRLPGACREDAKDDPEDPGRDRPPPPPPLLARDRPDPARDGQDADEHRQENRPRGERRQREPEGKRAEEDPEDPDRPRLRQLRGVEAAERLGADAHAAGASLGRRPLVSRTFRRACHR